jgi:hypothetical protein
MNVKKMRNEEKKKEIEREKERERKWEKESVCKNEREKNEKVASKPLRTPQPQLLAFHLTHSLQP